jgi:hypothetical protein
MPNNNFPGTGSVTLGYDRNFFQKISVTATTFGGNNSTSPYVPGTQPDMIIPFNTQAVMFLNLGTGVVEFSFNGQTVHGELNSANPSAGLTFDNRPVSKIWFRVQTGSTGPIMVSVQAWSTA